MIARGPYIVHVKASAEREIDRLPKPMFERVQRAILSLESNPRPINSKKLQGTEQYRLRVGDYRILYVVDDKERMIEIIAVGHRKDVYRGI